MRSLSVESAAPPPSNAAGTYTAVRVSGWRGRYEPWPQVDTINDPRLGLTFEQLTATLEPIGLPDAWDAEKAVQLAQAAWVVLSRKAGVTQAGRRALSTWQADITAAVITDVTAAVTPFENFAQALHTSRKEGLGGVGYGSPRAMWRRLVAAGAFKHVHGRRGAGPWRVSSVMDCNALDCAWEAATLNADREHGLLPVIDVRALSAMFPARRLVTMAGSGRPHEPGDPVPRNLVLQVPSFWEIVAVALLGGPGLFERRGRQCISDTASRLLPAKGDRPAGRRPASSSLSTMATAINGLGKVASETRHWASVLEPWQQRPKVEISKAQRAAASTPEPRVAPEHDLYRFERARALAQLDVARRGRRSSTAWRKSDHHLWLKTALYIELAGVTTGRVGELAEGMTLKDFDPAHDFGVGQVAPAVRFQPSKVDDEIDAFWHPIGESTARLIEEWIAEWGITSRDAPLMPLGSDSMDEPAEAGEVSGWFEGAGSKLPALRRRGGGGHGLHDVRHLTDQLLCSIAQNWLRANPLRQKDISVDAFVAMLMGHKAREKYAYGDLEANRQSWAVRGALGDPNRGVPGLVDLMLGDAGARRGWDHSAIRGALSRIEHAATALAGAHVELEAAEREVAAMTRVLERRPPPQEVQEHELLRWIAENAAINNKRESWRERRRAAEIDRAEANFTIEIAKRDLELIEARGRTLIIPDDRPLDDRADEIEGFAEAVTRVRETIASVDVDRALGDNADEETRLRVRVPAIVNPPEFAGLYGVGQRAVERWISGARSGPVRLDDAVIQLGQRLTFINLDRLGDDWWNTLTVSQREQVEQILRIPLGHTRHGGRSVDLAVVRAHIAGTASS